MRWIIAWTRAETLNKDHAIEQEITDDIAEIILKVANRVEEKQRKPKLRVIK